MDNVGGWTTPISQRPRYCYALPAGEYPFSVVGLSNGVSAKGHAKVDVTIELDGGEHGKSHCHDWFVDCEGARWYVANFFCSIGLLKAGQTIVPDWSRVVGTYGRCRVSVQELNKADGSTGDCNRVTAYVIPQTSTPEPF